ncbi:MAG: ABC transporter permease [Propionibacteriaceae bacterium]
MTVDSRARPEFASRLDDVLGGLPPARPSGPVGSSLTFGWRALLKIKHVPEQLLDVVLYPILFVLMFTYVFGGAIAGSPREYLQFALPGVLAQTVLFLTMYTAMNINTDIEKGVFDRFRTMAIWRPSHLMGALLADSLRYGLATMLVLIVGGLIGYRPPGGWVGVLAAVALLLIFCFALSWLWLIVGLTVRTPSAVMGVAVLILFPLTFVSSVYAPPETMPTWLQAFVGINPVSLLVDTARDLMNGTPELADAAIVLGISALIVAVFAPIALRIYNRTA